MTTITELVVAHDEYSGIYGFENPAIYGGTLQYNDDIIVKGARYLTTTQKPKKAVFRLTNKVIKNYSNGHTDISIDEYSSELNRLYGKAKSDDGMDIFTDIEDEIRWKRWSTDWKPVYEDKVEETILSIVVVKKPVSAYPEIVPISSLSDITSTKQCVCEFVPDSVGYLKTICNTKNITYEFGGLRKDNFEYATVLGSHLYYSSEPKFRIVKQGTYQQCVESRAAWIKDIESHIDSIILKKFPEKVKLSGSVITLIHELCGMVSRVRKLDVKKADSVTQSLLSNDMETKRNQIIEMLKETNKELLCSPTK